MSSAKVVNLDLKLWKKNSWKSSDSAAGLFYCIKSITK